MEKEDPTSNEFEVPAKLKELHLKKDYGQYADENGKIIPYNDPRTAKARSKAFPGIAKAMAEQWAGEKNALR